MKAQPHYSTRPPLPGHHGLPNQIDCRSIEWRVAVYPPHTSSAQCSRFLEYCRAAAISMGGRTAGMPYWISASGRSPKCERMGRNWVAQGTLGDFSEGELDPKHPRNWRLHPLLLAWAPHARGYAGRKADGGRSDIRAVETPQHLLSDRLVETDVQVVVAHPGNQRD